ncbi:helix-turn-helix domain-containing protein [Streptomyces hebeiensis]
MPAGRKPTVRSRRLGATMKGLRAAAGLDQAAAAAAIDGSVTKISRMERGQVRARILEVRALLDLYGVDGAEREQLIQLARDSNKRGWWVDFSDTVDASYAQYISMEQDATHIRTWETALIPGLLQTPGYVRDVLRANPTVVPAARAADFVRVRQERQARIEEDGVRFAAVIWEPAVAALAAPGDANEEQLAHLLEVGKRHNVTLQVLPLAKSRAACVSGPFVAFSFGEGPTLEAVTHESLTGTMVLEEAAALDRYTYAYDALSAAALGPEETAEFIAALIERA